MESSFMSALFGFVSIIPSIIVFIASCYYISKNVKPDSILLIIGSGLSLLLTIFYSFLMPYFMRSWAISVNDTSSYYTIAGIISFIAGICFAIGLFMLINTTVNTNKGLSNQFPQNFK
ncbi:hypothetical protein EZ449_02130 [Pedobacter frigidisoli]|uniref:Uncharacterized protein n=1 Tax=Pedobacter frigidisoli TaxID=2530455 RepID=A0A4R0P7V9_9SPHI|nr:hypothetical protein [Pedobacter frigidisoli]TCD12865.1 hypothetical protein EZ449_02130 [Pedobacter frigidisoli]